MDFVVGGRAISLTKEQVRQAVQGRPLEAVRTIYVVVNGEAIPIKQALSLSTGWSRDSFTSHEAYRVLSRLGFTCGRTDSGRSDFEGGAPDGNEHDVNSGDLILRVLAELDVLKAAVAGLSRRVSDLEEA